ncbi:MAG: glycine--tRNA ligase [Thermoplasmata archaeon]|nr:glycine--tRNA ligase [Thermoplasmata archaeon]
MKLDELFALLRRRGVFWPSAEIYGGAQGLYDYGPAGTALKRRLEDAWCAWFLGLSDDYHRIEPAEIVPEAVVRASGHLENFTDPEVRCTKCGNAFRPDTLLERVRPEGVDGLTPEQIGALLTEAKARCPMCGSTELSVPRPFNLMFGLEFGVTGRERAYLLPETAQASYLAFHRMWDVGRHALPLGIAVVGHAYRNEIAPRQLLFRMRSFTQAELQIFFDPTQFDVPFPDVSAERLPVLRAAARLRGQSAPTEILASELAKEIPPFYVYHLAMSYRFFRDVLGHPATSIRLLEKSDTERAFYNKIQFDIEVHLESLGGFKELGAVHYRGDHDLRRHAEGSGQELQVTPQDRPKVLPHVLELTFGVDRNLWGLADRGLSTQDERTVWSIPTYLAPTVVAIFPLIEKHQGPTARALWNDLRQEGIGAAYDDRGTIGKRYARHDELGTPFCVTVDGTTLATEGPDAGTVTWRERETKAQSRLRPVELAPRLRAALAFPRPVVGSMPPATGPESL